MKRKVIIYSASAAVLGIITVTAAYKSIDRRSKIQEEREIASAREDSIEIYRPVITSEPEPTPEETIEPIYYYLQTEGNFLKLYEIDGEHKKEVKSVEINTNMFPSEDRELLENGIKAFTLEEGIEIMENFIS